MKIATVTETKENFKYFEECKGGVEPVGVKERAKKDVRINGKIKGQ